MAKAKKPKSLKLGDKNVKRQSTICNGHISPCSHVSSQSDPRRISAAFAIAAARACKEQLVFIHLRRGVEALRNLLPGEQARGKARQYVWYLQSPGLLFLDVGREEHCVVTCFCGREDGAALGITTVQGRRGLENA